MSAALPNETYKNNKRTVTSSITVLDNDSLLNCDSSGGVINITLKEIPSNFSTVYKLYVKDIGGMAATNNITIIAPSGFKINNAQTYVINSNGESAEIIITSNTDYLLIASAVTPTVTPLYVSNTVFVDVTYGSNSAGLVERRDRPFQTKSAAVAAALAKWNGVISPVPSATNRILIWVDSIYSNEVITLSNFIDWNLNNCVLESTIAGTSTITDNNIAVNSIIYGQSNLKSTVSGGTTNGIYIQNSGSAVVITCNDITSTGTGGATIRAIRSVGRLTINFNNLTATSNSGNTVGIYADLGIIYATARGDVNTSTTNLQNAITSIGIGAKLYFTGNDVTASGTGLQASAAISAQSGGKAWIRCNDVNNLLSGANGLGAGAVSCIGASPELYVKCNYITTSTAAANGYGACQFGRVLSPSTTSAKMVIECVEARIYAKGVDNHAIVMEDCDSACVGIFKGRFVVIDDGGTNVSCVMKRSVGTMILDDATLVAIGSGYSISSSSATKIVKVYGAVSNKSVDSSSIIQQVNNVLVDSNVS